ncbi:MAG: serine protease [Acidobacteriota bacterium]
MVSVLVLATLLSVFPGAAAGQAPSVLHIKVVLIDAEQKPTPVARHALLISDNPPSAAPRRIVTALDGTADVRLRPGTYTVESDRPLTFQNQAYQWTQMVDIVAGRDLVLELTAGNAEIAPIAFPAATSAGVSDADPSSLLTQWQDSVVALWTATTYASGFVIGANGLVATSQRAIGTATSVDVQLNPAVKVAANVLVSDVERDVAILWIDPGIAASVRPLPLGCTGAASPAIGDGQAIFAIGAPLRQPKGTTAGTVSRVDTQAVVADLALSAGSAGGPVFTAAGGVVGITSIANEKDGQVRGESRIVRMDAVCAAVASAEDRIKNASPPEGRLLPVEPALAFPADLLRDAAQRRTGSLTPYRMASSDFDIAFITPVLTYGARYQPDPAGGRDRSRSTRDPEPETIRPLLDFSNWSEYVADFPPVLLVRVTPRLVEGFWTRVARGAAQTQGVSIPPIKRFTSGFARMQAFCGDAEVLPIHPFRLEQRISDSDAIYEGLYAFAAGALGPQCGSVKLVVYSEKEPQKGDTRMVDVKVVEQIWQDFAPYRALK